MGRMLLALLAAALLIGPAHAQTAAPPGARGGAEAAAEPRGFRLKGLDGKTYDAAEMRGEVLVVSFGATWCVPCTWELAAVEELKEEYRGKPVRFFWVSIEDERRTSDSLLRHYAKERRLTVPVLRDPRSELYSRFSTTQRIPLLAFFDREGRFSAPAHRGMSQDVTAYKQMVRARVGALLGEGAEARAAGRSAN